MPPSVRSLYPPVALLALGGCLEPRVSDEIVQPKLILPAGSVVPSIYDTADGAAIEAADGVDGVVPLLSGFSGGAPVRFWDFGPAPDHVAPLFRLVRKVGDALEPIAHPPIFGAIPGDPTYSPFWFVYQVQVGPSYNGELITSTAALNEAQARGLVLSPKSSPGQVDCPIVGQDVTLEVGGGQPPLAPTGIFYYEGHSGLYFDFGHAALAAGAAVPTADVYELRREGGDPISEPLRGVDLDRDGDAGDTNDIFPALPGDETYSPRCRIVQITVPATTAAIDTTRDQTRSDIRAVSDLFTDGQPIAGTVLGIAATERAFNCPQQRTPGGL
jgi:hypothetical protein